MATVTLMVNCTQVYQHINAESLPKGVVTKTILQKPADNTTLKMSNTNIYGLNLWKVPYTKDEIHNGDYFVSEYEYSGSVMRSIQPARVGINTATNYYPVKDNSEI